jgi:phosphate transport system permease protein
VLLLVTIFINCVARLLIWRVGRTAAPSPRRKQAQPEGEGGEPVTPTAADQAPAAPADSSLRGESRGARWVDRVMTGVLAACLVATVVPLFLILGYITYSGIRALNWEFFVELPKPGREPGGGMAHALFGSAMLVGLATLFAVPLGLLAAIFLAEYRSSRLGVVVRFIGELLAGVPSIVIGIFAYAVVVVPMRSFSGWAGAFALGVMMIPIVMRASEESLKLVPLSIRNASYALGATQWQTILRVIVPAALPAIITGVFLAIARIAGETAPLLLTAGNSNYWPSSPGDRTPFLPYYIYIYSRSGYPDWERQAWAAALVLLAVVMLLNVGIRVMTGKRVMRASRAD